MKLTLDVNVIPWSLTPRVRQMRDIDNPRTMLRPSISSAATLAVSLCIRILSSVVSSLTSAHIYDPRNQSPWSLPGSAGGDRAAMHP